MTRLSDTNFPQTLPALGYDRSAVQAGILHFGVGNFHRAHQAVYVDDLLASGDMRWGIAGVSLRSAGMRDKLAPQDYLYTLATLGETTDYRIIGSILSMLVAPENPQAVIDAIADRNTRLVSSTITEKGYYLSSGSVDFDAPDLKAEAASLDVPATLYGYLAKGLIERAKRSPDANLTILCCDNISGGGEQIKAGITHLLKLRSADTLDWVRDNVTFLSSMVDRVSPATDAALIAAVEQGIGCADAAPVSAEPFRQWIIEQDFAGDRPAFDSVGADFADDIAPFERMKLRYLNCAHTIVSTLGYLCGDEYVHESLARPEVLQFTQNTLQNAVLPNAAVPDGYDGAAYSESVIKRFQNGNLPYANLQVGTDSSQKVQQRWFPTVDAALASGEGGEYFALCAGVWVIFIRDAFRAGDLRDPKRDSFADADTDDVAALVPAFLKIANADSFEFFSDDDFMTDVVRVAKIVAEFGIARALAGITGR